MLPQLPFDVFDLIVENVSSTNTLASLAHTNRALSNIALDKLWYRLDDPYALAKCMSQK
jgi:hypothetical protein